MVDKLLHQIAEYIINGIYQRKRIYLKGEKPHAEIIDKIFNHNQDAHTKHGPSFSLGKAAISIARQAEYPSLVRGITTPD